MSWGGLSMEGDWHFLQEILFWLSMVSSLYLINVCLEKKIAPLSVPQASISGYSTCVEWMTDVDFEDLELRLGIWKENRLLSLTCAH